MKKRIAAVILAAGYSSRMEAFKPLLPMGKTTVVERCVDLFKKAAIDDIRVVVGHRAEEVKSTAAPCGVQCVFNPDYDDGMFSSVIAGVGSLSVSTDAFFILPVDIPLIRSLTLRYLVEAWSEGKGLIIHPCMQAQRGHPPLIDMHCADAIVGWQGAMGLKGALQQFESRAVEIEVPDQFILYDMDRPEDYEHLLSCLPNYRIPSKQECEVLLKNILNVEDRVCRHCRAVARLALRFGRLLNAAGEQLNLRLIEAAGRLHDLAKGQPRHARSGARILREMGFPDVADIVGVHMDIETSADHGITEAEIVYLADKMVSGEQIRLDYPQRFHQKKKQFADRPDIQGNIDRRLDNALMIQARMEKKLSCPLKRILAKG